MPTADASLLLPPPLDSDDSHSHSHSDAGEPRGSSRSLDAVGVETVLGAMIVQRRQSSHHIRQQSAAATAEPTEIDADDLTEIEEEPAPSARARDTRSSRTSEVFLKVR